MRKLQLYNVPRHNVNTTWKKQVEHFCIYIQVDVNVGCEQSCVDERDLSQMV